MNVMQRAAAIGRLQEMAERLPDGCFDRVAVKYGGGAWRCPACAMAARPGDRYCGYCGQRYAMPYMEG